MYQLENQCMPYAWGSTTAIALLQGRPASGAPEAELWMGAHPAAPSRLPAQGGRTLTEFISSQPRECLGSRVVGSFGDSLPFLFKVLAASEPLSLQAHPSKAQAELGFAHEEALGIPREAPQRNYKDSNHKPELICALTDFEALCGFRAPAELARLVNELDNPVLDRFLGNLDWARADALEHVFRSLLGANTATRAELVQSTVDAARRRPEQSEFAASHRLVVELAQRYPEDAGVVVSLMLNHLTLRPGQALFLPAGNLHAYLSGTGLELMANSDNVLRGGLTPKHVDVPELCRVLCFEPWPGRVQTAQVLTPGQSRYETSAREFELWRLELSERLAIASSQGPEILIAIEGDVSARSAGSRVALPRGQGVFVPADEGDYQLEGNGVVYRALVP